MYRDNTLIPTEAVRLLALGLLADEAKRYDELAREMRHFLSHLVGPTLDLVGPPLELLRVEGLVESLDNAEQAEQSRLRITESGREEMLRLLGANVRAPTSDINRLILTLKLRFLHLLAPEAQQLQVDALIEMSERELTRLRQLQAQHGDDAGHLGAWLDHTEAETAARLQWFRALATKLD